MDDVKGVDVLDAAKELVDEVLEVIQRQCLRALNDLMQIRVHQFGDDVDIFEVAQGKRREDIHDADYIFVRDEPQEFGLADSALGFCCMRKRVGDFFYGNIPLSAKVCGRAHNAILYVGP